MSVVSTETILQNLADLTISLNEYGLQKNEDTTTLYDYEIEAVFKGLYELPADMKISSIQSRIGDVVRRDKQSKIDLSKLSEPAKRAASVEIDDVKVLVTHEHWNKEHQDLVPTEMIVLLEQQQKVQASYEKQKRINKEFNLAAEENRWMDQNFKGFQQAKCMRDGWYLDDQGKRIMPCEVLTADLQQAEEKHEIIGLTIHEAFSTKDVKRDAYEDVAGNVTGVPMRIGLKGMVGYSVIIQGEPVCRPDSEFAIRNKARKVDVFEVAGEYVGVNRSAVSGEGDEKKFLTVSAISQKNSVRVKISYKGSAVVFSSEVLLFKVDSVVLGSVEYITAMDGKLRMVSTQREGNDIVLMSEDHIIGKAESIIEGVESEGDVRELLAILNGTNVWTGFPRKLKKGYFKEDKGYVVTGAHNESEFSDEVRSRVRYGVEYDESVSDKALEMVIGKGLQKTKELFAQLGKDISIKGVERLYKEMFYMIQTASGQTVFLSGDKWKYQLYRMLASHSYMRDPKRAIVNGKKMYLANIGPKLRCEQMFVPTIRPRGLDKWCAYRITLPSLRFFHDRPLPERRKQNRFIEIRKKGRNLRQYIETTSRPKMPDKTSPLIPVIAFTFSAPIVFVSSVNSWSRVWWEGLKIDFKHVVANSVIQAKKDQIETYMVRMPWGCFCVCRRMEVEYEVDENGKQIRDEKHKPMIKMVEKNYVFPTTSGRPSSISSSNTAISAIVDGVYVDVKGGLCSVDFHTSDGAVEQALRSV